MARKNKLDVDKDPGEDPIAGKGYSTLNEGEKPGYGSMDEIITKEMGPDYPRDKGTSMTMEEVCKSGRGEK